MVLSFIDTESSIGAPVKIMFARFRREEMLHNKQGEEGVAGFK